MELKVLGNVSPFSKNNKYGVGYLISNNGYKIMLDCGSGICNSLDLTSDLNNLLIIISHEHHDHYSGLLDIIYASLLYKKMGYIKNKIVLYLPKNMNQKIYEYLKEILKQEYFDIRNYDENDIINYHDSIITFKKTNHNCCCYSAKITHQNEKIVYSADTGYKNNGLKSFAHKADLFICEATFLKDQNKDKDYHLFAYEAGLIAKDAEVKNLLLTHFWPDIDSQKYIDEAKEEFSNVINVKVGKILRIGELHE